MTMNRIWLVGLFSSLCGCNAILGLDDPVLITQGVCGASPCQLLAVEPGVANTDATLTLEGSFDSSPTVNFPGGVSVAATVLGEHRALVTVPAGATAGNLTVATGGGTVGPLPFRRASFALGLDNFGTYYESSLATARFAHTIAVAGGYLYVLGGAAPNPLASVERARINADGSLGAFSTVSGVAMVTARGGHTSVVVGNSLYVLGGSAGSGGILNSVERATINADGSLSPFSIVSGVTLATARYLHTSIIVGNLLYVIGGTGASGAALASIERATINPDGSLGSFTTVSGTNLFSARYGHSSVVVGNSLYVVGGTGNGVLDSVERAAIGGDGSLGRFAAVSGVTLKTARYQHVSAVLGTALYVAGGSGTGGILNSVERAAINPDGSLGGFVMVSDITQATARYGQASVVVGNYLYALGGLTNAGYTKKIERASIDSIGALGTFTTVSGAMLTVGQVSHTSTVVGSVVYVIGGSAAAGLAVDSPSVSRATIDASTGLGSFTTLSGVGLATGRYGHTAAVVRDYLYVVGGMGGGKLVDTIERAAINADRSLGPFSIVSGVSLSAARSGHTSVVLGDYLYVVGGFGNTSNNLNTVERATINSDGSLSSFTTQGVALQTGRVGHVAVVVNDFLYIIGGATASGETGTVERASIAQDGSLGSFVTVSGVALVTARDSFTSHIVGNSLYIVGGASSTTPSAVERATINPDGSFSSFGEVAGVALATSRNHHSSAVLDNSLYVIAGALDNSIIGTNTIEQAPLP
jgi:Kelch motif protein